MAKNKVVDLKEYKSQKALEEQIKELDRYRNFMKLLKAVDEKYSPSIPRDE